MEQKFAKAQTGKQPDRSVIKASRGSAELLWVWEVGECLPSNMWRPEARVMGLEHSSAARFMPATFWEQGNFL